MKDVGGHKNLGAGVVGSLKKEALEPEKKRKARKRVTKKRLREGAVNNGSRIMKAQYLQHRFKTVATINKQGEHELKPTKYCGEGDVVWVMEDDYTFTKTKIY